MKLPMIKNFLDNRKSRHVCKVEFLCVDNILSIAMFAV